MPKTSVELPEDLVEAIKLPPEEVPMRLRRELAVRLYEKRLLGFGKARQLAEMTMWEFQQLLGNEKVLRSYDVEDLEKDLGTLEEFDSE
jgi:predicted HTH domain antitoxin